MDLKNFFSLYFLSFYSQNLYSKVAKDWKNWGLSFLIRFSLLASIVISSILFLIVVSKNFEELHYIFDQLPKIRIVNDEAKVLEDNADLPKKIYDHDGSAIAVVDLKLTVPDNKYHELSMVFTKDRLYFNVFAANNMEIFYKDLTRLYKIDMLDADSLIEILKINQQKLLYTIPILGIPLLSILLFIILFIKAVFYSLPASLVSKFFNYQLDFKQLTRVSVIINAPASSLYFLITILPFLIPSKFTLILAEVIAPNIYLAYFIYIYIILIKKGTNKKF